MGYILEKLFAKQNIVVQIHYNISYMEFGSRTQFLPQSTSYNPFMFNLNHFLCTIVLCSFVNTAVMVGFSTLWTSRSPQGTSMSYPLIKYTSHSLS